MATPYPSLADPLRPSVQYRKPVRGSLVWWLRFLGVTAFIVVLLIWLSRSGGATGWRIDQRWLWFSAGLTVLQLLLEALVWYRLLSLQRIRYPYPKTLLAYLASQYLGLVTPNHVGELLAAGHISMDTGITFGYGLSSVVMKKVLFVGTVVGFGVWSLPLLAEAPFLRGIQVVVWSVVVLVTFATGITLWVLSLRRLAKKWEKASAWKIDMTEFWAGMRQLCSPRLITPLAVAALAFCLLFVQLNAVLRSLGIALPFVLIAKLMALSRIVARFLPLSVIGFGSKDILLIMLLGQHGLSFAQGLTVTLLFLLCSHPVTLLLSGFCWWVKPLVIRRVAPPSS